MALTAVVAAGRDSPFVASSTAVRRWERGLLQILTVSWMYTVYEEFRAAATGSWSSAARHARQIVSIERAVGLNIEHTVQQLTFHLPWLVGLCNVWYGATHLVVPPIALVVLYRRAPDRYRQWRNVFLFMLGLSLLCFLLFPVLPPRLMAGEHRLVDTSTSYFNVGRVPGAGVVTTTTRSSAPEWAPLTNPMAAMPSLHVGWAIWASLALWPIVRRRGLRRVIALYPLAMIWSVMVTGNHWLLDTAGGAAVVGVAWLVTRGTETIRSRFVARPVEPRGASVPVA
jgi:membrane-associated phospholipid phosphatase